MNEFLRVTPENDFTNSKALRNENKRIYKHTSADCFSPPIFTPQLTKIGVTSRSCAGKDRTVKIEPVCVYRLTRFETSRKPRLFNVQRKTVKNKI